MGKNELAKEKLETALNLNQKVFVIEKKKLTELKGIERHTYIQIKGFEKVYAIADEDLPRENEEKTSAVHFMRFELTPEMISAAKSGEAIGMGTDLAAYTVHVERVAEETQSSLLKDFD
mgnify:CR=1 FL=1